MNKCSIFVLFSIANLTRFSLFVGGAALDAANERSHHLQRTKRITMPPIIGHYAEKNNNNHNKKCIKKRGKKHIGDYRVPSFERRPYLVRLDGHYVSLRSIYRVRSKFFDRKGCFLFFSSYFLLFFYALSVAPFSRACREGLTACFSFVLFFSFPFFVVFSPFT